MTTRDYFAGQAMNALIQHCDKNELLSQNFYEDDKLLVKAAYRIADNMIKQSMPIKNNTI